MKGDISFMTFQQHSRPPVAVARYLALFGVLAACGGRADSHDDPGNLAVVVRKESAADTSPKFTSLGHYSDGTILVRWTTGDYSSLKSTIHPSQPGTVCRATDENRNWYLVLPSNVAHSDNDTPTCARPVHLDALLEQLRDNQPRHPWTPTSFVVSYHDKCYGKVCRLMEAGLPEHLQFSNGAVFSLGQLGIPDGKDPVGTLWRDPQRPDYLTLFNVAFPSQLE